MKLTLLEFIHRLIFLIISIAWTATFFILLQDLQTNMAKCIVFIIGVVGFVFLGKYDTKFFKGKWI
jgi:hypothetical protein